MEYLFEIEQVFEISGRGCVIVPGIPHAFSEPVPVGSKLIIEHPDGKKVETRITGVEMINRGRPLQSTPFSVSKSTTKMQLPIGSKVFFVKE